MSNALSIYQQSRINYKNLPSGGCSYTPPGYCNSVWQQQPSCNFEMPKKSFIEKLGEVACGLSTIAGMVGLIKGLFPSKKADGEAKASVNEAKNTVDNKTIAEKTALEAAMNEADKSGDWKPVTSQVTQSEAEYNNNKMAIGECDSKITSANNIIADYKGAIDKLKAEKNDIDTKQIPDAKAKMESTVSASETKIGSLKAPISEAKAQNPNADTSKLEQAIKVEEDKITAAKTDFEKTKARLEDKKKQNNVEIEKFQTKISDQGKIVKTQTAEKNRLTQNNQKLQYTITEAKSKLEIHLGKTSQEK